MIKKGTALTCHKCHEVLALFARDVDEGDIVNTEMFDWMDGMECKNKDPAWCKKCGATWWDGNKIHTENGWYP